ncbi:MAG: class I SAM-dependent methyltransferase [Victivallaceae bacterium]
MILQEAYWDKVAGKKEFTVKFYPELLAGFLKPDSAILDVGCGYGRTLLELAAAGYTALYGTDISAGMLKLARQALPSAVLVQSSGLTIPFPDNHFDAALLIAVLTSITDDAGQKKLIAEIFRVLKPGGVIYAGDFLLNTDDRNRERYRRFEPEYHCYGVFELDEGAVLRHHDEAYIRQLLSPFAELVFKPVIHHTMNNHQSSGFIFTGRKSLAF